MMFRVRQYYLNASHSGSMEGVAKIAGVRPRTVFEPLFYDSSAAYKRIKKAGLLHLFDLL